MTNAEKPYRFIFMMAFSLAPDARFQLRPMSGAKESILLNYDELQPLLKDVEWDLHPGVLASHGDWPVESREEFAMVGAARLPAVREVCESKKYNGIVLVGGGDPCLSEAREIGHRFGVPVTGFAHSQMHIATMLGNRFSIIDISEVHSARMHDLVIQYRFSDRCASIRNINFPLPRPPYDNDFRLVAEKEKALAGEFSEMVEAALKEAEAAIEDDGAEVIVLGCSFSYWMRPILQRRLYEIGWQVPVLEGYSSALEHLKLLVNLKVDASGLAFPIDRPTKWRRRKTF